MSLFIDFSVIFVLVVGIWQFREPRKARFGNLTAAFALLCALVLVLYRNGIMDTGTVVFSLLAGAVAGYFVASAVSMIQIPAMVAFQHGAGGVAAFLVSLVELTRGAHALDLVSEISGVLGLTIGSLTFSGSMIASAKLANKIRQAPIVLPSHQFLVLINIAVLFAVGTASFYVPANTVFYLYIAQIVLSSFFRHPIFDSYWRGRHAGADIIPERYGGSGRVTLRDGDREPIVDCVRGNCGGVGVYSYPCDVQSHEPQCFQGVLSASDKASRCIERKGENECLAWSVQGSGH